MTDTPERFAFGKNWEAFLTRFTPERLEIARQRLLKLLRVNDLTGMTFLDIGSGSGLHSLAAWNSGAKEVVSFDYDQNSVNATRTLWEMAGKPDNWRVIQGSVLDADFMDSLGKFDIVYSWGVLHHTGDTWLAIRNARRPLADNGVFCIALYSATNYQNAAIYGHPTPEEWLRIKQAYNKAGAFKKHLMEYAEVWRGHLRPYCRNPLHFVRASLNLFKNMRTYKKYRGMDFMTDVRDWLGGWPMDFVRERDVVLFGRDELGLESLDIITGEGNTEFVFRPAGATNYWNALLEKRVELTLNMPFKHAEGHMYFCSLPELADVADNSENPHRSPLMLFEDGIPLDFAHTSHDAIRALGKGRYSHWGGELFFSPYDNADPNTNGRTYTAKLWAGEK